MALCVLAATILGVIPYGFSRVVFLTDWLLTLVTAGGLRLGIRVASEADWRGRGARSDVTPRRVLVVGAGAAGCSLPATIG